MGSVPDHCLSFYFDFIKHFDTKRNQKPQKKKQKHLIPVKNQLQARF